MSYIVSIIYGTSYHVHQAMIYHWVYSTLCMHTWPQLILYIIGEQILPEELYTCSSKASDNDNVIVAVVATLALLLKEGINALVIATVVMSCYMVIKYVSYTSFL